MLKVMGCGISTALPSKKGYVSVVQSLVAFSKAKGDDDESKKCKEKQTGVWFNSRAKNLLPASHVHQETLGEPRSMDKAAKYKDKFDSRVTARLETSVTKKLYVHCN